MAKDKPRCPVVEWRMRVDAPGDRFPGASVSAWGVRPGAKRKERLAEGSASFDFEKRTATVEWAQVEYPAMRRCGLGTQVYERLLQAACERGLRLVSDKTRSISAEKFWEKQVAKKRAKCIEPGSGDLFVAETGTIKKDRWKCTRYGMTETCPRGGSLRGARAKICRTKRGRFTKCK